MDSMEAIEVNLESPAARRVFGIIKLMDHKDQDRSDRAHDLGRRGEELDQNWHKGIEDQFKDYKGNAAYQ